MVSLIENVDVNSLSFFFGTNQERTKRVRTGRSSEEVEEQEQVRNAGGT